jgi:hypothetical protein
MVASRVWSFNRRSRGTDLFTPHKALCIIKTLEHLLSSTSISSSKMLPVILPLGVRQGEIVVPTRVRVGVSQLSLRIVIAIFTIGPRLDSFHHPSSTRIEPPYGFTHTQKRCRTSHNPLRKSPRPQPCPRASAKANTATTMPAGLNLHQQTTPTPSAPQDSASKPVAGAT